MTQTLPCGGFLLVDLLTNWVYNLYNESMSCP